MRVEKCQFNKNVMDTVHNIEDAIKKTGFELLSVDIGLKTIEIIIKPKGMTND